jgi:hypothetical protein
MYAFSGGIPRILNSIADNCLLAGYARSLQTIDGQVVERVAQHLELKEVNVALNNNESIHQDVLRASASWKEVVRDIRSGSDHVPPALKQFVENLQVPTDVVRAGKAMSAAIQRGE